MLVFQARFIGLARSFTRPAVLRPVENATMKEERASACFLELGFSRPLPSAKSREEKEAESPLSNS